MKKGLHSTGVLRSWLGWRRELDELYLVILIAIACALTGCQSITGKPVSQAGSTTTSDLAHAKSVKQIYQETQQRRAERDRLKAEPSAQPTQNSKLSAAATNTGSPAVAGLAGLQTAFARLADHLGGSEGLAFTSGTGAGITQFGSWQTGPAWSTAKVPLAVATVAKAHGRPDSALQALLQRAITASDNAAAEQLWADLGEPETAAAQVQAVLRSTGDSQTRVQSQQVRPGFTAFGQTIWSLASQARFVAELPCINDSGYVLQLMGDVEPDQRWGIGAVGVSAKFKGGWGPGPGGGYLVRQMGMVSFADGSRIELAIASEPADGRFETGTTNLTALARWAVANVRPVVAGGC
jgi:hypothetical protein